jgi:hypothetical protein
MFGLNRRCRKKQAQSPDEPMCSQIEHNGHVGLPDPTVSTHHAGSHNRIASIAPAHAALIPHGPSTSWLNTRFHCASEIHRFLTGA